MKAIVVLPILILLTIQIGVNLLLYHFSIQPQCAHKTPAALAGALAPQRSDSAAAGASALQAPRGKLHRHTEFTMQNN